MTAAYEKLMERVKDITRAAMVSALLEWDQETYMPSKGLQARAEQIALISGLGHEWLIADETHELLEQASASPGDHAAEVNLRETRRKYERAARKPLAFVKELALTSTLAREAWVKARNNNDFDHFTPLLGKIVELKRQEAEYIGYEGEPYNALMDEFEPGSTAPQIESLFSDLVGQTRVLLKKIEGAPSKPDPSILSRHYPAEKQQELCQMVAHAQQFDFEAGRADVSVHPFCTTIGGGGDVRFTTRYLEDFLPASLFGTMHEVGHALYEQGLLAEHVFTPMGEYLSLGVHESQSRLWENLVGRSRPFWDYYWPIVRKLFPEALADVNLDAFYGAINTVRPSFIRVEADELTYNLHIVIRFEIERALIAGSLEVAGVPDRWNAKVKEYLGLTPPTNREGCLQDIHWSMGAIGYFHTYALGNLYAAQFFAQARKDLPDLDKQIRANDLRPLLEWLRSNIHEHGKRFLPADLVQRVTGRPPSIDPFMAYVRGKYGEVYSL